MVAATEMPPRKRNRPGAGVSHPCGRGQPQSQYPVGVSYFFHPGAEAEHFEAIAIFESRQPDLGAWFNDGIEKT